jgi:hypothetical protein
VTRALQLVRQARIEGRNPRLHHRCSFARTQRCCHCRRRSLLTERLYSSGVGQAQRARAAGEYRRWGRGDGRCGGSDTRAAVQGVLGQRHQRCSCALRSHVPLQRVRRSAQRACCLPPLKCGCAIVFIGVCCQLRCHALTPPPPPSSAPFCRQSHQLPPVSHHDITARAHVPLVIHGT